MSCPVHQLTLLTYLLTYFLINFRHATVKTELKSKEHTWSADIQYYDQLVQATFFNVCSINLFIITVYLLDLLDLILFAPRGA